MDCPRDSPRDSPWKIQKISVGKSSDNRFKTPFCTTIAPILTHHSEIRISENRELQSEFLIT
nr:MAG TPA: hypothetical protein [Caudoviricetes sp.]